MLCTHQTSVQCAHIPFSKFKPLSIGIFYNQINKQTMALYTDSHYYPAINFVKGDGTTNKWLLVFCVYIHYWYRYVIRARIYIYALSKHKSTPSIRLVKCICVIQSQTKRKESRHNTVIIMHRNTERKRMRWRDRNNSETFPPHRESLVRNIR